MLNQQEIKTMWPGIKYGLRNLWGRLSEEEIERANGDFSVIAELVEERYGTSREEIHKKIDLLLESYDNETDKGHDPDKSSYRRSPIADDWNARH